MCQFDCSDISFSLQGARTRISTMELRETDKKSSWLGVAWRSAENSPSRRRPVAHAALMPSANHQPVVTKEQPSQGIRRRRQPFLPRTDGSRRQSLVAIVRLPSLRRPAHRLCAQEQRIDAIPLVGVIIEEKQIGQRGSKIIDLRFHLPRGEFRKARHARYMTLCSRPVSGGDGAAQWLGCRRLGTYRGHKV